MRIRIPYLERRRRRTKRGVWEHWYWVPSKRLRAAGWEMMALGSDPAIAREMAIRQNADVQRALAVDPQVRPDTVAAVIRAYRLDEEFTALAEKTRESYGQNLDVIERWAGDKHVRAVTPKAVKAFKLSMRATPYKANAVIGMIRILYGFAYREGLIELNPAHRFKRYTVRPRSQVWEPEIELAFSEAAVQAGRRSLMVALALSIYAGQRETDVLAMKWSQYDGARLHVTQSKTGERVAVPVLRPLKAILDATGKTSTFVVVNEHTSKPYAMNTFVGDFGRMLEAIGQKGQLQFRDARRTSVVRMFAAGLSYEEISDVTGHRIEACREIVETYLPRGRRLTPASIEKLESYYEQT